VTEWKLFDGGIPLVSTFEFHEHRERAAHLEQAHHELRLHTAARMIRESAGPLGTFSDLGCGDGGLLSLVQGSFTEAWGYDFQPSNEAGWKERGVQAELKDVFSVLGGPDIELGNVVACTEVLEHLADPHGVLKWLHDDPVPQHLVCSSPVNETGDYHDSCHAWAWDYPGYEKLATGAGWTVAEHAVVGMFQVMRLRK